MFPIYTLSTHSVEKKLDTKYLVGSTYGHVFHLACLLQYEKIKEEDLPESVPQVAVGEPPAGEFEKYWF